MAEIDKSFVKKSFNRIAPFYDHSSFIQKKVGERLLRLLDSNRLFVSRVLDVGMGTGNLTSAIVKKFPDAQVYGCDIAYMMIKEAGTKSMLYSQVPLFLVADTEYLPYRQGIFDIVMSSFTYQWLERLDKALKEAFRVLKPGGVFLASAFGNNTFTELRQSYEKACKETGYTYGRALKLSLSEKVFASTLTSTGFFKVFTQSFCEKEQYQTVEALLRSIKAMGGQNASDKRNRSLGVRKVWSRMVKIYKSDFKALGAFPATYEVIIGGGRKPG